jgi:predicted RNA-binding protein Jag
MNKIALYMKNLGISEEEAKQLIEDEENDNLPVLTSDMKKVASEMTRAERKKETKPRVRSRKQDNKKRNIILFLADALTNARVSSISIPNPEREIAFTYEGDEYQLLLIRHRPAKD